MAMLSYRTPPCLRFISIYCSRCLPGTPTIFGGQSVRELHAKNFLLGTARTQIWLACATTKTIHHQQQRCYSLSHPPDTVSPPSKLKRYLVDNCVRFAEWYERFLERRYPKVFQVYKIFKIGIRDFIADTKMYYDVTTDLWTGKSLNDFTRKELGVYRQYPKDVWKVSPVLIISALPFANYVVFPIAYMYPKWFLSPQFWTSEQKETIWGGQLAKRLRHCPLALRHLRVRHTHMDDDHPLQEKLKVTLNKIRHFQNLSVAEILDLKPLFEDYPCHIEKISIAYVRQLAKCNNLPLRRSKLIDSTLVAHYTDLAMGREGIENLNDEELAKACYERSLNPVGISREEQLRHLCDWVEVSRAIDENSLSLLLHLPIFLAYNKPTNRQLSGRSLQSG